MSVFVDNEARLMFTDFWTDFQNDYPHLVTEVLTKIIVLRREADESTASRFKRKTNIGQLFVRMCIFIFLLYSYSCY